MTEADLRNQLMQKRNQLIQKHEELMERYNDTFLNALRRGVREELFNNMTKSLENCAALLDDADPSVGSTAILVAKHLFEIDRAFSDKCWIIFQSATDVGLKTAALGGFAKPFSESGERLVGERLARIVLDASESVAVRSCAYDQLILVTPFDSPLRRQPYIASDFVFPDSVDWEIVHSYLN